MRNDDFMSEVRQTVEDIKDISYNLGKDEGMLDVWDFLSQWESLPTYKRKQIFGTAKLKDLIEKCSPLEAEKKLKDHEDKQKTADPDFDKWTIEVLTTMACGMGWCSRERTALTRAIEVMEKTLPTDDKPKKLTPFEEKRRLNEGCDNFLDTGITQC